MFERLAQVLEDAGIRYCILHGWQGLPERLSSDLDIVLPPEDLEVLESSLRHSRDWRVVQLLQHETSCYYFVLALRGYDGVRFILVDAAVDYRREGRVYFSSEELLKDRRRWNGFWVAAPRSEFAYLLVKRVSKGILTFRQVRRLRELSELLGERAGTVAVRLFGSRWGRHLLQCLDESGGQRFEYPLAPLKRALRLQVVKRDPLNPLRYSLPDIRRIWLRWRHPTGLLVAVLGPDGAGKSTLIDHLESNLLGAFRRTAVFHLRPNVLGRDRDGEPVTDPHGKPPRSWWVSVLKGAYYMMDYTVGYLFMIRPRLVRSTLVLFDRYFDDLLVDARRYRYGGPTGLLRFARKLIPRPDLFLVLDVPVAQLLSRKREIAAPELARQRRAYRRFAAQAPNAVLLDGSLPAPEVAKNATDCVLDHLHRRYLERLYIWLPNAGGQKAKA